MGRVHATLKQKFLSHRDTLSHSDIVRHTYTHIHTPTRTHLEILLRDLADKATDDGTRARGLAEVDLLDEQ